MTMNFFIGQKIEHGPAYAMKCSDRFETPFNIGTGEQIRDSIPTPLFLSGTSFVIGLKLAIVENYKYKPSRSIGGWEGPPEELPASASGKKEECLVCIRALKPFRPYLVRKKDVKS